MADKFFEQPMEWQDEKISIRISFGIASVMEDSVASGEALLTLADERLYRKKRARKSDG